LWETGGIFKKILILSGILPLLLQGCELAAEVEPLDVEAYVIDQPEEKVEAEKTEQSEQPEQESQEDRIPIKPNIQIEAGKENLDKADFIENDNVDFSIKTDLTKEELAVAEAEYEVTILYEGQKINVLVEVVDTTPPIISGAKDITIYLGDSVSYKKKISLQDNSSGEIILEVDSSAVNIQNIGDYPVIYTATDESGNSSSEKITLHIVEPPVIDETTIVPMADEVIAQVITQDMSKSEMAYVLWNWCRENIYYTTLVKKYNDVWHSAYQGFHDKKGSCYAYAYTYSVLLSRCGIDNVCVMRVGGDTDHIWNLVNAGEGWYHCDASPRKKGDTYLCYMQTDAQIQAYTDIIRLMVHYIRNVQ